MMASASSSFSARTFRSGSSPNAPNSTSTGSPIPTPSSTRPFERWSSETAWRATTHGRRRGSGVTIGPRMIRSVPAAMAASRTHGSWTGSGVALKRMWSHRKKPSHPAASASRASSTMVRGSAQVPKFGMLMPYLMGRLLLS